MLFSQKESLQDRIIRLLLEGEQSVKGIKKLLGEEQVKATVQGIYKVFRILVAQEIVIKRANMYSLSEEWRGKVVDTLSKNDNRFELAEGERISFDLASLVHLDQQWKNIVLPFHNAHPKDPIFFYNPHEIWMHLSESRKESELVYYASFKKSKSYAFCLIGGATVLDTLFKKELQHKFMQVAVGIEHFTKTDYPTIFSDYIITTRLSPRLAIEIEDAYKTSTDIETLQTKLHAIGLEKKKVRLIIERDKEKAKKLRKKLSKEFFVPQELVKEFNLY